MPSTSATRVSTTSATGVPTTSHIGLSTTRAIEWIGLSIAAVAPAIPVEHTPITVTFALTNKLKRPLNGQVRSQSGASVKITNLAPDANFDGTIGSLAPAAGPISQVSIDFYDDDDRRGGEFPLPSASALYELGVSATYAMQLDSLFIKLRGHAWENDVVTGSVEAKFGDSPLDNPDDPTDHLGKRDVFLGAVPPTVETALFPAMRFAPFTSLAGTSAPLYLTYAFVSGGGQDIVKAILNVLSSGAEGVLDVVYPQAAGAWKAIDDAVKVFHDALLPHCGRPVACDNIRIPSEQLLALTSAAGSYTQAKEYIVPPPGGYPCLTSDYVVKLTITRTSFKH